MKIIVVNTISLGDIVSDIILIFTFFALVWYSFETRALRQWQKKQVQSAMFNLDIQRVMHHAEHPEIRMPYGKPFPLIMREIYELGEFDLKDLYSSTYHDPLVKKNSMWNKIKTIWSKKQI